MTDTTKALERLEAAVAAARRTGRFPTEEIQEAAAALGYEIVSTHWLYPDGKPIEPRPGQFVLGAIHQAAEAADREDRGSRPADRRTEASAAADPFRTHPSFIHHAGSLACSTCHLSDDLAREIECNQTAARARQTNTAEGVEAICTQCGHYVPHDERIRPTMHTKCYDNF